MCRRFYRLRRLWGVPAPHSCRVILVSPLMNYFYMNSLGRLEAGAFLFLLRLYTFVLQKSIIYGLIPAIMSKIIIQCSGILEKEVTIVYLPDIGAKIKRLRSQRNMSQVALAAQLGVSKSVISSYENCVNFPPYDVLIRIAKIFGVSTDFLLGVSGNRTVNVDGLSDVQIEALTLITSELKAMNRSKDETQS